jgi:hypothetical protein
MLDSSNVAILKGKAPMAQPNGGNGGKGGSGVNSTIIAQQLQLLKDIIVTQFTASPATVQPFQTTTVSYQVQPLPNALFVPVTFSISGQKVGVELSGSATFPVTTNRTFELIATNPVTDTVIATTQVAVNPSQCSSGTIPGIGITSEIKTKIDQGFAGFLSGTGSTVTLSDELISIQISINPPGGGGTMNIAVEIGVYQNGQSFSVIDQSVTVQVHLNTDLNVSSWCSDGMQQIVQPFMKHIVDNEIVPAIVDGITTQINSAISAAEQADPTHRTYVLTTFALTIEGVSFQVCPSTPGT